jgi:hypothetical protein
MAWHRWRAGRAEERERESEGGNMGHARGRGTSEGEEGGSWLRSA